MRLFPIIALFMLSTLLACNPFARDNKSEHPENKPQHKIEDAEFQKLRKQQDSLLDRQKKPSSKDLDTLKPKQA